MTITAGESYFHAKSYQIKYSLPGYADQIGIVKADIDGWYFGNILFGGLIGFLIVDPITGKMWKISNNQTFGNLLPEAGTAAPAVAPASPVPASKPSGNGGKASLNKERVLKIACLDQVPQEMRKYLVRLN